MEPNKKVYIAFDLATTTGFAIGTTDELVTSGAFRVKKANEKISRGELLHRFKQNAVDLIERSKSVDVVIYFELVEFVVSRLAYKIHCELAGALQLIAYELGIPVYGIPVGTIKKHATTKGNAKKDAMMAAATKRFPEVEIVDDNHADALMLLEYARTTPDPLVGDDE